MFGAFLSLLSYILSLELCQMVAHDLMSIYNKPYLITWLQISSGIVLIPIFRLQHASMVTPKLLCEALVISSLTLIETYAYNVAISGMRVATANSLAQLGTVFVYFSSILFLQERCTLAKSLCVLSSITGAILITVAGDSNQKETHIWALIAMMVQCLTYPAYLTAFSAIRGNNTSLQKALEFVALQGACSTFILWIPLLFLNFSSIEKLAQVPRDLFLQLFVTSFFKPFMQTAAQLCISLSSPLFFQLGITCVIPFGIIVEHLWNGFEPDFWFYIGSALVMFGSGFYSYTHSQASADLDVLDERIPLIHNPELVDTF